MSKGAKDADVDRLTRERIEELSSRGLGLDKVEFQQLCDLALSALSQEAVRDEALGPTPEQWQEFYDRVWDSDETNPTLALPTSELQRIGRALLAALKREPNAAAESYEAAHPKALDELAAAAPDVASMVTRLNEAIRKLIWQSNHGTQLTLVQTAQDAAALLAKLGQGWIPVGWMQERKDGRKSFYEGNLDPREVHDNGCPTYQVFKVPGASDD